MAKKTSPKSLVTKSGTFANTGKAAASKTQLTKYKLSGFTTSPKRTGKHLLKQARPVAPLDRVETIFLDTKRLSLRPPTELVQIVNEGVPISDTQKFLRHYKFQSEKLFEFVGESPASFRKRKPTERLHSQESDRFVRFARLMAAAEALHEGDADAARRWMESPNQALGGVTPLEYASTEVGAREVEQLIGRLEHGVFS